MEIKRDYYLNKLIKKMNNGYIKVITGIRRSGKSYLLFNLFHDYLISIGISGEQIIEISLDETPNIRFRNPIELDKYIRNLVKDQSKMYYVFIDEIQKVEEIQNPYIENVESKVTFVDTVVGLMKLKNVDLYVTGSNSKMLSTDIITDFKDRGDEIRLNPLTFKEFYEYKKGDINVALEEYFMYGGMPKTVLMDNHEEKSKYLKGLFNKTYLTDVIERHKIVNNNKVLDDLINTIASSVGSLTNSSKLSNTFLSVEHISITPETINNYLNYFIDSFLLNKVERYDIKGKKYINSLYKYYFTDIGLRNARLNFRQIEDNHIMENIVYNQLLFKEFDIDIGIIEYNYKDELGNSKRKQLEVDFVCNKDSRRYYIQSALNIDSIEKRKQEINSLLKIKDSFKKIVIIKQDIIPYHDDNGVLYIGLKQFLLDDSSIDL